MDGTVLIVALIAAWEVAPVAAVGAAAGYVPAQRYRRRRRLAATRKNIAALERELGYDVPLELRIERELRLAPPPAVDPVPATLRIQGFCDHCSLFVVVNDGKCNFGGSRTPKDCAKDIYRSRGERKATQDD